MNKPKSNMKIKQSKKSKPQKMLNICCLSIPVSELMTVLIFLILLILIAQTGTKELQSQITMFVLGCWVGYLLIWNVKPALHTPLMSLSNAISGIVIIGGIIGVSSYQRHDYHGSACETLSIYNKYLCIVRGSSTFILNALAIGFASMNVFGGFSVTQRMLNMFVKEEKKD